MKKLMVIAVIALPLAAPALAFAQDGKKYDTGASDSEIKIGQSIPYSGPASFFGVVGRTMQAWFRMLNENGGIGGRKVELTSRRPAYRACPRFGRPRSSA